MPEKLRKDLERLGKKAVAALTWGFSGMGEVVWVLARMSVGDAGRVASRSSAALWLSAAAAARCSWSSATAFS